MHRKGPLTILAIITDYVNSFFSLDRSLFLDLKNLLIAPKAFVENYWNGFRKLQSSPNRILVVATLVVGLVILQNDGHFLSITMDIENFSSALALLILTLPLLILSSVIVFIRAKKSVAEHIVLGSYVLGFWLIIFSPLSLILGQFDHETSKSLSTILFLALIFIWVGRVFHKKGWITLLLIVLHMALFVGLLAGLLLLLMEANK